MSMREVLATVEGCLGDGSVGLAVRAAALATSQSLTDVRTGYRFVPWNLADMMQAAPAQNVCVRPRGYDAMQKLYTMPQRDAVATIEIAYEFVGGSAAEIKDNVTITSAAILLVLDGIVDYSNAHGGTILDVVDPITWQFGEYATGGPATSSGCVATVRLLERSTI